MTEQKREWLSGLCFCHLCQKNFDRLGIMRHRAMHRDKKEDCKITFSGGNTYSYPFSGK